MSFPKALGTCVDKLYSLRQQRLAKQKEVDKLEAEEKALKEHIINTLPKSESTGIAGKLARATIVKKEIPQVHDWDRFYKFVLKTKHFDLLQRRLADTAVKERWDAGEEIPGVEAFQAVTVSLNKV
jgi:hypothetical protein